MHSLPALVRSSGGVWPVWHDRPTPRLAHAAQAKSRTPGRVRGDGDAFVPLTDDEKGELVSQALEALEAEGGAVRTGLLCGVHAS